MQDYILEMKGITKSFSSVKALDDVTLRVKRGEIRALVGENGAGKSTLMRVLSGVYPHGSFTGELIVNGKACAFREIAQSEAAGIAIIHQELALIPTLSVAENILLGHPVKKRGLIDWNATRAAALELMQRVGLSADPDTPAGRLGVGQQQLVEIAKALSKRCSILLLDEPTAALNEKDSENLLSLLRTLNREGMTCILISHKLGEVCAVADSVTVIRDGRTVADFDSMQGLDENEIIRHMVGRPLENRYPEKTNNPEDAPFFEVRGWTVGHPEYPERKVVRDLSITLRKGEVVGLSGLMGAGRTEFAMSLFGRSYGSTVSGEVRKDGKVIDVSTVSKAIENGIAYVPEDRQNHGLLLEQTICKNISLSRLRRVSGAAGVLHLSREIAETRQSAEDFGVKCSGIFQRAGRLSGGNQQKVLLAKWMFSKPDILILDEPTRGIDVGAKYDIYRIINDLAAAGKCILVISSELPEILGICDRVYVMGEGEIRGEMMIRDASQERIMRLLV